MSIPRAASQALSSRTAISRSGLPVGFGRVVALHHRSSALHHIYYEVRRMYLYF